MKLREIKHKSSGKPSKPGKPNKSDKSDKPAQNRPAPKAKGKPRAASSEAARLYIYLFGRLSRLKFWLWRRFLSSLDKVIDAEQIARVGAFIVVIRDVPILRSG